MYHCQMNFKVESIQDLDPVVEMIISLMQEGFRIFLLSGDLGAGKTTLVKMICSQVGVHESVTSPTFSLVNEYESSTFRTIYHMDFYRLEKVEDLEQIGLQEYLSSGYTCFIEWPALGTSYFYPPFISIKITVDTDNIRIFNITRHDAEVA